MAMGNLKSSIKYMMNNNEENRYERALQKNKSALKYFMTEVPERID